jgi:hypothetical protein
MENLMFQVFAERGQDLGRGACLYMADGAQKKTEEKKRVIILSN